LEEKMANEPVPIDEKTGKIIVGGIGGAAAAGAVIGSIVPGVGTLIGAGIGGIAGSIGVIIAAVHERQKGK
jgi:hypothetical protein